MKKIKVLLSALAMVAAMAFVSCGGGADPTTGGTSGSDAVKLCKVEYSGQWGGATTVIPEGAKAVKYVFASVPSEMQFIYQDSVANPNDQYGNPYCAYSGAITTAEVTINLEEALNALKTQDSGNPNATGVAKVVLQNMKNGTNSIVINSITIIKADDTEESAGLPTKDWGSTVTAL